MSGPGGVRPGRREAGRGADVGAEGVERIIEIELNGDEKTAFEKSVGSVKGLMEACQAIAPNLK